MRPDYLQNPSWVYSPTVTESCRKLLNLLVLSAGDIANNKVCVCGISYYIFYLYLNISLPNEIYFVIRIKCLYMNI